MLTTINIVKGLYPEINKSTLQVKKELLGYKKIGLLFFDESLSSLEGDTPFDILYHHFPNEESPIGPFPVPAHLLRYCGNQQDFYFVLQPHFQSYYPKESWSVELFDSYDTQAPFIGRDYIWYPRKKEIAQKTSVC